MSLPDITVVATTWLPEDERGAKRLDAFHTCLLSWHQLLQYEGSIHLVVADDGSSPDDLEAIRAVGKLWTRGDAVLTSESRRGVGRSLNRGLQEAFKRSPLVFHAVDDWLLYNQLVLTPWAQLLTEPELGFIDPGAVRFFPHPDLTGRVKFIKGVYAIDLDAHHFAFATRPSLWHQRMFDTLGWFEEDVDAYRVEFEFNERWASSTLRPPIWLALPDQFFHVPGPELADITPRA